MFKKVIAGIMSAVLCTTALLSDAPARSTVQKAGSPPEAAQQQEGVSGTNSLAKYLQQKQTPDTRPVSEQLQAQAAAEPTYSVTNLEFDRETGLVRVMSSQNYAQKLVVLFVDEDDPSNVYRLEATVAAGELVLTELTADCSKLPDFFTVTAYLVNRLDQPACEGITLKNYTHFVQEMQATDLTGFEPEQVVNLDESTDTNFIVLSGDTVQAESSDTRNTLISADYDHNVFVFGDIDETVRSLKNGQFFYIRPSEEDIIATQILDIEIEDDTATITGADNIDEMFDFIKIEIEQEDQSFHRDLPERITELPASETEDPAAAEDAAPETEQTAEQRYLAGNYAPAGLVKDKDHEKFEFEIDAPGEELYDPEKSDSETTISASFTRKTKDDALSVTAKLEIKVNDNLNVYKRFTEFDYYFTLESKITVSVTGKSTSDVAPLNQNLLANLIGEPAQNCGVEKDGSKDIKIATPIPGIFIVAGVNVSFTPTVVGTASITYHAKRGLHYDGKLYQTFNGDEGILERRLNVKAGIEIKLSLHAGLSILGVLEAGVDFALKLELYTELKHVDKIDMESHDPNLDAPEELKDRLHSFAVANFEDERADTVHACMFCLEGTVKATFTAGVYLKLLVFKSEATLLEIPIWEGHFYFSLSHNEFGFGKCPHIAYKTTFQLSVYDLVHDRSVDVPAGTTIMVDGETYTPDANGTLVLYCVPKENHTYIVLCDNHKLSSGSFQINDEVKTINIPVELVTDKETGEIDLGKTNTKIGGNEDVSVTPVSTEPAETFTPPMTTDAMPLLSRATETVDAVQLGAGIWGHAYPNGGIWIHGIGDMYDFNNASPFNADTRKRTRYIVLEDADPEHDGYINNIGQNVFKGFENLECVYMPARIRSINNSAFEGCANLKYLRYGGLDDKTETFILPSTLQSIGNYAFFGCTSAVFGELNIPESVSAIGIAAFTGCEGITSVYVPGVSEPVLGEYAFDECINLKKAVLTTGIKSIGKFVFEDCCSLEDLTVPTFHRGTDEDLQILSSYFNPYAGTEGKYYVAFFKAGIQASVAYSAPKSLTTVTVLNGDKVADGFFWGMASLKQIFIKDTVTSIGNNAFRDCTGLEMIDFGNTDITTDSVILPETLTEIGENAFYNCMSLKLGKLSLPKNVETVGSQAFHTCSLLTEFHAASSTTAFRDYVFVNCTGLKNMEFGPNVTRLGFDILSGCTALEELALPYCGQAGTDYNVKSLASLFHNTVPATLKTVRISNSDKIAAEFFMNMTSLETVIFDQDITEIGAYAFWKCSNLKEFRIGKYPVNTFPETLAFIDWYAFNGCSSLPFGDLIIPPSVTKIGQYAFTDCTGITSVDIPGGFKEDGTGCLVVDWNAFTGCTGIRKIHLGAGFEIFGRYVFTGCSNVEELTMYSNYMGNGWLENGVYEILDQTSVKSIKRLTIQHAEEIKWSYCTGMTQLESVTLPANLKTVVSDAFKDCEALEEAYLIGEDSDWDNVEIDERGNDPLLRLVRKAVPVVITADPADVTANAGETVSFRVAAAGKYALNYQWQSSDDGGSTWKPADSTGDTLTFTAADAQNRRLFRCTVTDEKGNAAVSAAAKLTISGKAVSEKPEGYRPGDLNGDGQIDVSDVVLLARFVTEDKTVKVSGVGILNADVDGNGNAGIEDITIILQYIARIIRVFPVDATN